MIFDYNKQTIYCCFVKKTNKQKTVVFFSFYSVLKPSWDPQIGPHFGNQCFKLCFSLYFPSPLRCFNKNLMFLSKGTVITSVAVEKGRGGGEETPASHETCHCRHQQLSLTLTPAFSDETETVRTERLENHIEDFCFELFPIFYSLDKLTAHYGSLDGTFTYGYISIRYHVIIKYESIMF